MILQELDRYYQRKSSMDPTSIAPEGLEDKEISFVIVLDKQGNFVDLQDLREGEGRKKRGKMMTVPASVKRSGTGARANFLWDKLEYVLGVSSEDIAQAVKSVKSLNPHVEDDSELVNLCAPTILPKKGTEKSQAFIEKLRVLEPNSHPGVKSVVTFLSGDGAHKISKHLNWPHLLSSSGNLTFRLQGEAELVCQNSAVLTSILNQKAGEDSETIFCLIRGRQDQLAKTHPSIKGISGGQTSGGNIVSFNTPAFRSQGKEQGANATVGKPAAFSYTTALNHLLRSDSRQRIQIADTSTVFWASDTTAMEDCFGEIFEDNPDIDTQSIRAALTSMFRGEQAAKESTTRFFVLGLSPNAARIAIRFWHTATVAEIAEKLSVYFEELRIIHPPKSSQFLSFRRLLNATAALGKSENVNPRMAGEMMRAILSGGSYPRSLLDSILVRIRAEHEVDHPRAALLKAWLNRQQRLFPNHDQEIHVALDPENTNPGYRLGRLFAVLEKAQEEAVSANATIRDRYYGAASSTPASVFPILLKTFPHHIGKLPDGRKINLDKLVQNILLELREFPRLLRVEDQGRFALGYYHQRQEMFTSKVKPNPLEHSEIAPKSVQNQFNLQGESND